MIKNNLKKKSYLMLNNFFVATLISICKEYHQRVGRLEGEKIDSEYEVARKELEARIHIY